MIHNNVMPVTLIYYIVVVVSAIYKENKVIRVAEPLNQTQCMVKLSRWQHNQIDNNRGVNFK